MKTGMVLLAASLAGASLVGCSAPAPNEGTEKAASADHEATIRANIDRWLGMVRNRDAAGIAQFYAEDGVLMPPNAPAAVGRAAIEEGWRGMMSAPGVELTFVPEQIVVASGEDMLLDRGTYRMAFDGPNGRVTDTGKYLVVWRNIGGEWKVAADMFNSDLPAPGAAPAGTAPPA